jgi:hypothetical protein
MRILFIAFFCCLCGDLLSAANTNVLRFVGFGPRWGGANNAIIRVSPVDGDYLARFTFENPVSGDLKIGVEKQVGENTGKATLLVYDDRLILERDEVGKHGLIDLSAPNRIYYEAIKNYYFIDGILWYLFPDGPDRLPNFMAIHRVERNSRIVNGAGSEHVKYAPPWSVVGEVRKQSDGKISFQLEFSGQEDGSESAEKFKINGSWWKDEKPEPLDRKMLVKLSIVDGWMAFGLCPWRRISSDSANEESTETVESLLGKIGPAWGLGDVVSVVDGTNQPIPNALVFEKNDGPEFEFTPAGSGLSPGGLPYFFSAEELRLRTSDVTGVAKTNLEIALNQADKSYHFWVEKEGYLPAYLAIKKDDFHGVLVVKLVKKTPAGNQ